MIKKHFELMDGIDSDCTKELFWLWKTGIALVLLFYKTIYTFVLIYKILKLRSRNII